MRHTIYLLAIAMLSLASCTKNNNASTATPVITDIAHFQGNMNDAKVTVYMQPNSSDFTINYRNYIFDGIIIDQYMSSGIYHFTAISGGFTATGSIHSETYPIPANYSFHTKAYIQLDPGSLFESNVYTMTDN